MLYFILCQKGLHCNCKDVAVPLMRLPCWEKDTLFLVFEEDFRFEPEGEDSEPVFTKAATLQEVVGQPPVVGDGEPTMLTANLRVP